MLLDMGFSRPHVELAFRKKRRSSTKFDVLLDWLIAHPDPTAAFEGQCANRPADAPAPTREARSARRQRAIATTDSDLQRPGASERRRPCRRSRARSRELEAEEEAQLAWALAESLRMAEEPPIRRRRLRSKTPPGHRRGVEGAAGAHIPTEPQLCSRRLRSKTPPVHRCGVRDAVGMHPDDAVDSAAPVWAGLQRSRHGGFGSPLSGRRANQEPSTVPRANSRRCRLRSKTPEVRQEIPAPSPRNRDDRSPQRRGRVHGSFWARLSATYAHDEPGRAAFQPRPDVSSPAEMSWRRRRSKTPPRQEHWSLVEESRVAADAPPSCRDLPRSAQEERPVVSDLWARLSSTYSSSGQSLSRSVTRASFSQSPERAASNASCPQSLERAALEAPGDRRRPSRLPAPSPRRAEPGPKAPAPCHPSSGSDSVLETAPRHSRSRARRRRHAGPLEMRDEPRSVHRQLEEDAPLGRQPSRHLAVKPDVSTPSESLTKPWLLPVALHDPWEPSQSRIRRLSAGGA